jgi:hypothetical protein
MIHMFLYFSVVEDYYFHNMFIIIQSIHAPAACLSVPCQHPPSPQCNEWHSTEGIKNSIKFCIKVSLVCLVLTVVMVNDCGGKRATASCLYCKVLAYGMRYG